MKAITSPTIEGGNGLVVGVYSLLVSWPTVLGIRSQLLERPPPPSSFSIFCSFGENVLLAFVPPGNVLG